MQLPSVDMLEPAVLNAFRDARGVLVPIDLATTVPFPVARVFWVSDVPSGTSRGGHAHKACQQYLVCITGAVCVDVFDGTAERSIDLAAGTALHVRAGIFATERYASPGSVLMVFCDRAYERSDYLTDRAEFVAWRVAAGNDVAGSPG